VEDLSINKVGIEGTSECAPYVQKLNDAQARMVLIRNKDEIRQCRERRITDCQAAKQFEGMMVSYKGTVTQLLRCLLVERSAKDYAQYDLDALEPMKKAQELCVHKVTSSADLRSCYQSEYEKQITDELKKRWPLANKGC
jgi:hypothetical protein